MPKVKCPRCSFVYNLKSNIELQRSHPQNSLYWGIYIKIIADHIGELTTNDLHEELKLMFNPKDSRFSLGEKLGGTTTQMTRKEFSEYLEKIRIWALTFHEIDLPLPE